MKARAASLYGKNDIRIREMELPEINDDEVLVKNISNSICLSTYKAALLGKEHKRVPEDVAAHPAITGHEFCGVIVQVGNNLHDRFKKSDRFVLQPAMGLPTGYSAGYSYEYFGGNATYCIIPKIAIDKGCMLPYESTYFANASLSEPMSCIIGAYHATYHTKQYVYEHFMGVKEEGSLALLGCAGPMGIGAIDYAVNGPVSCKRIVVTDIDEKRLQRASALITPQQAQQRGKELCYLNTSKIDAIAALLSVNHGNKYDDVFVFAASPALLEQGDDLLGNDGCLNFFAGPTNKAFKVPFNFYNVHYEGTHIVGTSGGSTSDMVESLTLSSQGSLNPSYMITHIGGLDSAPDTILNLPNRPGGKRIVYPHIKDLKMSAIADFEELGKTNELFKNLHEICERHQGVWCEEAESYLFEYYHVTIYD